MTAVNDWRTRRAQWPADAQKLRQLREVVFIREQAVPPELEWDGSDDDCLHVIAEGSDGAAIGTGRLTPAGQIGRMAVLRECRRSGVGRDLLRLLLKVARDRGDSSVFLHAQVRALAFYVAEGFEPEGEEFMEAGIRHITMRRRP